MDILQALVLAIIQGLTEFLPISSSGHLVLASQLSGWADQGVAFDAAVHLGTLFAIVVYLRNDLKSIILSLLQRKNDASAKLGWQLLWASLPVLVIGYLSVDWVNKHLRTSDVIAWSTIFFGLLLLLADQLGQRNKRLDQLRLPAVVLIGLAQVLALIPGTSRSGICMTAGLALGLSRQAAARFAFLLAIPVLIAAGGYSLLKVVMADTQLSVSISLLLLAMLVSAVVAFATIAFFLRLVERVGMLPFALYRIVLGLFLLIQ